MAANEYHFITHWLVEGGCEEVYDLLSDAPGLVRWWPTVYLKVEQLENSDAQGVGKVVQLLTKGWLPCRLRWQFRVTKAERPTGFELEAWGDLTGRGIWSLTQQGTMVAITYDWKVRADKPLLQNLSFIFKPIFSANHRWAMDQGERSLRRELARLKARTDSSADYADERR